MTDVFTGRVGKVSDVNKWGFYSFKLVNNDTWFGTGKKKPSFKEGAFIKFEAEVNPKGFWNAKEGTALEIDPPKEVVSSAVSAAHIANGYGSTVRDMVYGKDTYWQDKTDRDIHNDALREYGATRNTAIEWVRTLLQYEAVKLPTKTADREAILQALLTDTIKRFGETNHFTVDPVPEDKVDSPGNGAASILDETDQAWN